MQTVSLCRCCRLCHGFICNVGGAAVFSLISHLSLAMPLDTSLLCKACQGPTNSHGASHDCQTPMSKQHFGVGFADYCTMGFDSAVVNWCKRLLWCRGISVA